MNEDINKKREIIIVEPSHIGRSDLELRLAELAAKDIKVVVIEDNNKTDMNTLEINGVKYREKEKQKPMSKALMSLMVMSGIASKENPKVDIVKEYGLIQHKRSRLSRSQRDWVVWQFEKNFERVI